MYIIQQFSLIYVVFESTLVNYAICMYIYIYIYIIQQFSLKYVVFESTLLNFTQTLTKLDLPTLRKGSIEERTQRKKKKSDTRWESNPGPRLF